MNGNAAVRVTTGSRLHFGLVDPTGATDRRYGGAGVIVDAPRLAIAARIAPDGITCSTPTDTEVRSRVLEFAARSSPAAAEAAERVAGVAFDLLETPPQHSGLGSGTQLGLCVAAAIDRLHGGNAPVQELATRVSRGRRSAIGIWGFECGGFLVDAGKAADDDIAPLVTRHEVPAHWRFLLAIPSDSRGLSGPAETTAFRAMPAASREGVKTLERLARRGLATAVAAGDIDGFGEALWEYGCRAAEPFRDAQGGLFSNARTPAIVDWLHGEGVRGVGQSSWGPTVFAVLDDPDRAAALRSALTQRFQLAPEDVICTGARNRGAAIEWAHGLAGEPGC